MTALIKPGPRMPFCPFGGRSCVPYSSIPASTFRNCDSSFSMLAVFLVSSTSCRSSRARAAVLWMWADADADTDANSESTDTAVLGERLELLDEARREEGLEPFASLELPVCLLLVTSAALFPSRVRGGRCGGLLPAGRARETDWVAHIPVCSCSESACSSLSMTCFQKLVIPVLEYLPDQPRDIMVVR